jgi:hypothetical protein
MKSVKIYLRSTSNIESPSINDVKTAIDSEGIRHTNQYLKPEGGLFTYKNYINMLVSRFKYKTVEVLCDSKTVFYWESKQVGIV